MFWPSTFPNYENLISLDLKTCVRSAPGLFYFLFKDDLVFLFFFLSQQSQPHRPCDMATLSPGELNKPHFPLTVVDSPSLSLHLSSPVPHLTPHTPPILTCHLTHSQLASASAQPTDPHPPPFPFCHPLLLVRYRYTALFFFIFCSARADHDLVLHGCAYITVDWTISKADFRIKHNTS